MKKKNPSQMVIDDRLFLVRAGVSSARDVREGLLEIAEAMHERVARDGHLVLPGVRITAGRLREEWARIDRLLRPEIASHVSICHETAEGYRGIPNPLEPSLQAMLSRVVTKPIATLEPPTRGDAAFVVLKVLVHHWLSTSEPITTQQLARTAGYSYLTIAKVLNDLGSWVDRTSDRRVRLRWASSPIIDRLISNSTRARSSARFADSTGNPRSVEAHVARLEKLAPASVALGGVLGAFHHQPDLDLTAAPRLDISQHCPGRRLDLRFVRQLDPGLVPVTDPTQPASVVVHAVRHEDPLFTPRAGGLAWADALECFLDLVEARLPTQAAGFWEHLTRTRPRADDA